MSYGNRPFFPDSCSSKDLDKPFVYDTMLRIAGTFFGVGQALKTIVDRCAVWLQLQFTTL